MTSRHVFVATANTLRDTLVLSAVLCLACASAQAGDVYGVRFDPPRCYFTHASINKSGVVSGLSGQDNFLSLYMPPVDKTKGVWSPEGFTVSLLLPAYLEMQDVAEGGLTITEVRHNDQPYLKVTKAVDPEQVKRRCFDAEWGVNDVLWYRVKLGVALPKEPTEVKLSLLYKGQECFTDAARLKLYAELPPVPRVSPKHFRLWLHYGPHFRNGHWDELADTLNRAGINTVQCTLGGPDQLDYVRALRERGFYIIAQRGGSYEAIYKDNMRSCLEQGPKWFEQSDQGTMRTFLPLADAALWDYEPSPLPENLDDWLIVQFRQARKLPADEVLTTDTIKAKHLREWIDFRQTQLATCIKHWADFCRSVKPEVETILTEGSVLAFDPPGGVDYSKYQDYVTFCDPMNFDGLTALHVVQQWMQTAPRARFTGCQNVALSSYHNVFVSADTIMLQAISAALIGMGGTAVYPGPAMDAENFVRFHRVMSFLSQHEKTMFEGTRDTDNVLVEPLPKEQQEFTLGDGRKLRQTYPDWQQEALRRCYRGANGEMLVVLVNWNLQEPCYFKLTASLPKDNYLLVEDEHRQTFTTGSKQGVSAKALAEGVHLQCPPGDFRGFRIVSMTPAALKQVKDYRPEPLTHIARAAKEYARTETGKGGPKAEGDQRLALDDFDRDGKVEYVVQSGQQKVWVSQQGTVLRWTVGDQTVETEGLGLCRDMIWLPQGERENRGMDAAMKLESREVHADGVTLTFSKNVPLVSMGGGASVRIVRELAFSRTPGEVAVRVRVSNTSVAPEATKLNCSYRVHNYLKYPAAGNVFWAFDGAQVNRWEAVETSYTVPRDGLSDSETGALFTQNAVAAPQRLVTFGEFTPSRKLLVKVTPEQPERLLQLLRWGRKSGLAGSGTVEWMYRPEMLEVGKDLTYEYRLNVQPGVASLDAASARPATRAAQTDPHLLLHLAFDGVPDATIAKGEGKPTITGTPTYEDTPTGKGIRIGKGTSLSYLPAGNINLEQGRVYIRFKPNWEGAEAQTHLLVTVRPRTGFVYLGKTADGRFLLNLFDEHDGQHYPTASIRTLRAGTWHEALATWNTTKGVMALFWDGQKAGEYRADPWKMAVLDNALPYSRLTIPEGAEAVIDEIKVWDEAY